MTIQQAEITTNQTAAEVPVHDEGLAPLIAEVRRLVQSARQAAATTVNTLQVLTNFEIGRRIVEHEQAGNKRAVYGSALFQVLSAKLTMEFGKGFSVSNLQLMRKFFIEFQLRIQQKPSVKLTASELPLNPLGEVEPQFRQSNGAKSPSGEIAQTLSA